MLQSLLMKAAMLAATVALVLWIGWPTQQDSFPGSSHPVSQVSAESAALKPVSAGDPVPRSMESHRVGKKPQLDINLATVQELQALPGIGEVLAKRVIEYRGTHGPFQTVEGLMNVKGIGPKRMEQLRPLLAAGASPASRPRMVPQGAEGSQEGKGL
jgi:competence protein ComEA